METTSFSFPLIDIRGTLLVVAAISIGLSFFALVEVGGADVVVGRVALGLLAVDGGSRGDSFSFFGGVASARMSSSSIELPFFRFEDDPLTMGFSLSFSVVERRRWSFSRSIARTS